MLRDYCNFVGMKTQIQGVQDATAAWNSEKRLQMFGVIPHHRRDTVTGLHSQFRQGIGKPPGPAMEFAVAGAMTDLSGFRETISTRGKILPARSRMVGSVNGKSIIVPRIRVLGQGRSLAHPTIKQDQPSAADMLVPTC